MLEIWLWRTRTIEFDKDIIVIASSSILLIEPHDINHCLWMLFLLLL